ncbi:MAG: AmmeMemoRadiSam system protein A [bacterium]
MLDQTDQQTLLQLAHQSIVSGLKNAAPSPVTLSEFSDTLREPGAAFVTLTMSGQLRGCIGSLTATRPLAEDVAENAFAAAFRDPRFPPVSEDDLELLHIEISVLEPAVAMNIKDEQELFDALQPNIDGLILDEGPYRATFLPTVWESLPTPREFVTHLKLKAGLPQNYWSDTIRFSRYQTQTFE